MHLSTVSISRLDGKQAIQKSSIIVHFSPDVLMEFVEDCRMSWKRMVYFQFNKLPLSLSEDSLCQVSIVDWIRG